MKYLIMCEGPNELEVVKILLENDLLIYSSEDLLNLVPYHARQIATSPAVKAALNLYSGTVEVIRIGDKLSDKLVIPKEYREKIHGDIKCCTKPELEMLLIISEGIEGEFEKVKSISTPKEFSKQHITYNRIRYNNSSKFYREYYGARPDLLKDSIIKYKRLKGKHKKDEGYLADLLK